jgi:hypothetical protein
MTVHSIDLPRFRLRGYGDSALNRPTRSLVHCHRNSIIRPAAVDSIVARSVIRADVRKKKPRRRLGKAEDVLAAEDGVIVIVLWIAIVDGLAALDTRAIFRREEGRIGLGAKLRGVANGAVVHERQSCHAGDGGGIVCLQRRAKLLDEAIEFLLQGRRSDGLLRRLGDGWSKVHESGCEHNSQQ